MMTGSKSGNGTGGSKVQLRRLDEKPLAFTLLTPYKGLSGGPGLNKGPAVPEFEMQTQNPFLDEIAKLTTAAMGLAQAAGEETKAAMRAQADKIAAEFDLIRRDEFDALKAELVALRAEVAALKAKPAAAKKAKGPSA